MANEHQGRANTIEDSYPLSTLQQGMLIDALLDPGSGVGIEQTIVELHEALDVAAFQRAWRCVVVRHPVLRTRFRWASLDEPRQEVHAQVELPWEEQDWRGIESGERANRIADFLAADCRRGFDMARAPLFRLTMLRYEEAEFHLIATYHHAVLDGRSRLLVLREVFAFYEAFRRGEEITLPLPRPYRDYIDWLQQQDFNKHEAFWRKTLKGFTAPTPLVVDHARSAHQDRGVRHGDQAIQLSTHTTAALRTLAKDHQLTLNTIVQGAWALLLSRYSGEPDAVFGVIRANRRSAIEGAEAMTGLFINTLPLRVRVNPESALLPWLNEVRLQWTAMREHEQTPPGKVLAWSEVAAGSPLFESIVIFENRDLDAELRMQGGPWANRRFRSKTRPNFPLALSAFGDAELILKIRFHRSRIDDAAVARMLGHLQMLLEGMAAYPQARLKDLPLLTQAERQQLLVDWNDTRADYAGGALLQESFEAQVARAPGRTALRFGEAALSYAELEARANRLAQGLRSRGVGRGQRVGLCLERGADMLAAVLGILKAGAAYVPLDPSFPQERLRFMAEDAQLALIVSTTALADPFGLPRERQLLLDADAQAIASAADTRLPVDAHSAQPGDPAYVIYTSGSTGEPKGVVVPHRAVVNFLASMAREPGFGADDVLVAVTTLSFDIAVLELQLPLTLGATVVMASRDEAMDGRALKALVERHRTTVMQATPVTWRLLLEAGWSGGTPFKALVGGEALPKDLADRLLACGVELWNMYGPTETTVWSTCARITETSNGIVIGKPIANTTVRILDAYHNLCPIGVPGELCIGGEGVAPGYWNRPELTAERFVPDPFSTPPGATLYRTGDRARWRDDGMLEHLGRLDFQVKLHGYRIEPGEIETGIVRHPAVRQAVVVLRDDVPGDKRLVAYLVTENAPADLPDRLRALIRARMPEYMVPVHFVSVDALPLTPNGKIDRNSLPSPRDGDRTLGPSFYVAPRNDLEISLATAWEKVLGVQRIGITDNFFELGGNSLGVLKLIFEMEQATGIQIDLGDVFQFPTIARLVTRFGPDAAKNASVVVPLQREGEGVPIFCICGINIYKEFAQSLGKDQPVFGVYVREEQAIINQVIEGKTTEVSIKRLVEAYDKAIARFRPHGPYRLAGFSFGGILAIELASSLRRRGAEVDLVMLLDTVLPQGRRRNWIKWFSYQASEIMKGNAPKKFRTLLTKLQDRFAGRRSPAAGRNEVRCIDEAFAVRQEVAFINASENWQAQPANADFRVILFRASDKSMWGPYTDFDEDYGWRRYLGDRLRIVDIIGGHRGIIEPPNVSELGRIARQYLRSDPG